ncbi:hypothetical protein C8F01DRAFT_707883 [Mycena amicta]|nr:hypothetical protein C8F01DRAFT_707883 [Mycena amicta]
MALFPSYSNFFISGLISPPSSSPSSLRSRDSFDVGPRRGSLPTDSSRLSSAFDDDDASKFYFTLQQRDSNEYRSFLSLDLAESLSLRSHSMKRKPSARRPRRSREPQFSAGMQIPDSPNLLPPPSPAGPRSPGTPRSIPSPKPAPVSTLPNVPPAPPVVMKLAPAPQRKPSVMSHATRASATTSAVSTRYRRRRRDKALACLEGRRPPPPPPFASTDNFMSFSDDEEDEAVPTPEQDFDLSLTDDQLIMLIARLEDGDLRSAPPVPSPPSKPHSRENSSNSSSSAKPRRKSALGLKSFMDFHNDDDSSPWTWPAVVQVAS